MKYPTGMQRNPILWGKFTLFAGALIACMLFTLAAPLAAFASPAAAVTPPGPDWSHLPGIYKIASKPMLVSGETLTYTIHLEIGWTASYLADVSDPLPAGLDYVANSANLGGAYDATTRTVSWTGVTVAGGAPANLTFEVKDTATVDHPTPTINIATITVNGFVIQRAAWVTLLPVAPVPSPLAASFKSASPRLLGPGDTVTYSIQLVNSGKTSATAAVSDPVPAALTYVTGSASSGGVYDATTKTLTWSGIVVPSMASVLLTFAATAPAILPPSIRPLLITNTATISSGGVSFTRSADVMLVTQSISPLAGSYKAASVRAVAPGGKFTYTISLHNSGAIPRIVAVTDPLPAEVTYVDGSANAGGVYDATTRTLSWSDLSVLEGTTLALTFDVTAESPAAVAVKIVNTATITSGTDSLKRSATVVLLPSPGGDRIPPVVQSFTIGDQDVLTSPDVTLHIQASDNVGVTKMYLVEWALTTMPFPHWQVVKSSGWIPYQADFPWTLGSQNGTHFMGVWVADAAMNHSRLTRSAIDFASLVLPNAHVAQGDMIPYLVYYPAGVDVTAVLKFSSGEAHLFVWHPGNMFAPDETTPTPNSGTQTITFTTKTAGIYMFLVYGVKATDFDLSITPPGGPRLPIPVPVASTGAIPALAQEITPASITAILDGITYNPILPVSGLDPLDVAIEPASPGFQAFVPVIR
jgi:uncharacterized repeat protein (TIGR01451 family)